MKSLQKQPYLAFFPGLGFYWMPDWEKVTEIFKTEDAKTVLAAAYILIQRGMTPDDLPPILEPAVRSLAASLQQKGINLTKSAHSTHPTLNFEPVISSGTRSFVNRKNINWERIETSLREACGFELRKREFLDGAFDALCPVYYVESKTEGVISEGKGYSDEQARRSALAEAVERLCGTAPTSDGHIIVDSYENLYKDKSWHLGSIIGPRDPFAKNIPTEWIPAVNLYRKEPCFLPAEFSYFGYSPQHTKARLFSLYHTTGLASGSSLEEAALNGIFEVLERDAYWVSMRCKIDTPNIPLEKVRGLDPKIIEIAAKLKEKGFALHLKDMSLDWGIPIVHAILEDASGRLPAFTHGTGAAFTWQVAVSRAVCEALQMYSGQLAVVQIPEYWREIAAVSNAPARPELMWSDPLFGNNIQHLISHSRKAWDPKETVQSVDQLLEALANKGHEVLVARLATFDDLKVVRVCITNTTQPDPRLERISPRLMKWKEKEGLRGFFTDPILT